MHGGLQLLFIAIVGAALRFAALDRQPLWLDEASDAAFAARTFWDCVFAEIVHPPLYRSLLHFITQIFGDSILALRLLPALFGTLTIPVAGLLARMVDRRIEIPAALLTATSPFLIYFSQENRNYSLFILLSLTSTLYFLRFRDGRGGLFGYSSLAILLLYTHYLGALVLLAHEVVYWAHSRNWTNRWLLSRLMVLLAFLPWMLWVAERYYSESRMFMPLGWFIPVAIVRFFLGFGIWVFDATEPVEWTVARITLETAVVICSLAVYAWLLWQGRGIFAKNAVWRTLFFTTLALPWILLLLGSPWIQLASVRYLSFQAPFFLILVAAGLSALHGRRRRLASGLLSLMITFSLLAYYAAPGRLFGYRLTYAKENWPGAAAFIRQAEADVVIIAPGYLRLGLGRYPLGARHVIEVPNLSSSLLDLSGARRVALLTARSGPAEAQLIHALDATFPRISAASFRDQNLIRVVIYDATLGGEKTVGRLARISNPQ